MTWVAFFVLRAARMRLCPDLNRGATILVAPLASITCLPCAIVRVAAEAEASTLSNNADIAGPACLRRVSAVARVECDGDVRAK